ncbi:sterol desaturase family protein [Methylocystis sp. ATCC 49242]|uniref:sterol desaturase family protein n=1 Tax=Methylocystis sp. ATCC 49242 TaxID=622637 RepID=UPI0001F86D08|nr:sterol desaturase family protein [Methylocystis sp. ATCC 49242]
MSTLPQIENILLLAVFCLFASLLVLEKKRPYVKHAGAGLKASFSTNASAFIVNNIIMNALSVSSLLLVAGRYSHFGLLGGMSDGPLKWVLSFVLFDFVVYVWHLLGHKYESLWLFHKIHHSDKSFHVTTGLRFHVFDQLLEVIVKCVCAVAIGVEAHVVVVCEIARMFFVLFHHANITIPGEKWLSYFIITPSLHRAHHSTLRSEHDSNYGIVLAIWDILFGTRKEIVPKSIGLELIEADNLLQLFSLAFLTERRLARVIHLLPRKRG